MRIEVGAETDVGKVRERNEDGYLVQPPLYAVADGMGGHRGGAVASQLALDSLRSTFRKHGDSLGRQVRDANDAVFERSIEDRAVAGMGTTLTAIQIDGDQAILAHVGDSRAYLLRAGDLRQLTEDHTLVNRMVKAGELTPQEAEVHPHRNVLVRSLGTEPSVRVDELSVGIAAGDRLLVCSDGLTGMVTEEQIKAILESTPGPDEAAQRLIRAANRAGGIDNITVVVLDVHDDEEATQGDGGASFSSSPSPSPPSSGPAAFAATAAPTLRRWGMRAVVTLLVAVAVLVGLRVYLDRQWYVGVSGNHVAVFQGIPAQVLGFRLHHAAEVTELPAARVEHLQFYGALAEGITAADRNDAERIVTQMRTDLAAASTGSTAGSGG